MPVSQHVTWRQSPAGEHSSGPGSYVLRGLVLFTKVSRWGAGMVTETFQMKSLNLVVTLLLKCNLIDHKISADWLDVNGVVLWCLLVRVYTVCSNTLSVSTWWLWECVQWCGDRTHVPLAAGHQSCCQHAACRQSEQRGTCSLGSADLAVSVPRPPSSPCPQHGTLHVLWHEEIHSG